MFINRARREISLKIVYFGPALSGKTTNLQQVHDRILPAHRTEMVSLKTSEDRTLYFDFMQLDLRPIAGLVPRLQLYTVPGQARYEMSRRIVLRGADGVVFVADSSPGRQEANQSNWQDMWQQLEAYRLASPGFPMVIQLNKRDIPRPVSQDAFLKGLNLDGRYPVIEAVASRGEGVQRTLSEIISAVMTRTLQELPALERAQLAA
jgi:signal recognition particle receptor subunit beta